MKRIKLADVAAAAGVSQGTVSHVFNHPELVRPELRRKVEETAKRLGYQGANPAARILRAGKVGSIGVVTSNPINYFFDDPFARLFMSGVAEIAEAQGAGLSLISTANEAHADWTISSALVDSFIVLCAEEGDPLAAKAARRGLPTVRVDCPSDGKASGLVIDDQGGARLIAEHLIGLGHRRLGVLAIPSIDIKGHYCGCGPERMAGYRSAVEAAGLGADALVVEDTNSDIEAIRRAMRGFRAGHEPVTGILAMSDLIAFRAMEAAMEMGLDVPSDISIAGFDDVPEAAVSRPPLTTIRQPVREKGAKAVELLLSDNAFTVEMPVELVIRGSTGPI